MAFRVVYTANENYLVYPFKGSEISGTENLLNAESLRSGI
jgi:hypothetical protein